MSGTRDAIERTVELALYTDGGHHKQWALLEVAEYFGMEFDEEDPPEEGIAP